MDRLLRIQPPIRSYTLTSHRQRIVTYSFSNLLTLKNDTAHKLDTATDPYFKITSDVKKNISPRVQAHTNPNIKIKCQVNLTKVFKGDNLPIVNEIKENKENLYVNEASNGIRLPGKFIQSSRGIPMLVKPHQKGLPKVPKH